MAPGGKWNGRRLVLFTEWEATRRWLQRRLGIALADLDLETPSGARTGVFTGATTQDRREALKILNPHYTMLLKSKAKSQDDGDEPNFNQFAEMLNGDTAKN